MESSKIKVTTIDYYHRDPKMQVTCGRLPKKLKKDVVRYINDPAASLPSVDLMRFMPDYGAGEHQMESLLEYIRQNPNALNEQKCGFVTNKQVLKLIASNKPIDVKVIRVKGVIYMLKMDYKKIHYVSSGKVFEEFMTEPWEDSETNKNVTKAVLVAEIPRDSDFPVPFRVFYSGVIDAIDENCQHYGLKLVGNQFKKSSENYWQAVFGNVPTMIIGLRSAQIVNEDSIETSASKSKFLLNEIKSINVAMMPYKASKDHYDQISKPENYESESNEENEITTQKSGWTIEQGEERLRTFLSKVNQTAAIDGKCVIFSKKPSDEEWSVEHLDSEKCPFYQFVNSRDTSPEVSQPNVHQKPNQRKNGDNFRSIPSSQEIQQRIVDSDFPIISQNDLIHPYLNRSHMIPGMIQINPETIVIRKNYETIPIDITNGSNSPILIEARANGFRKVSIEERNKVLNPGESFRMYARFRFLSPPSGLIVPNNTHISIEWMNLPKNGIKNAPMADMEGTFHRKFLSVVFDDNPQQFVQNYSPRCFRPLPPNCPRY